MQDSTTVAIVDDDVRARESLNWLLNSVGINIKLYSNARDYLHSLDSLKTHCLILDVCLPGMSGPTLQEKLLQNSNQIPTVFISGHADVALVAKVMKNGAIDFFPKPYNDVDLLDAVQKAQLLAYEAKCSEKLTSKVKKAYELLSKTEKKVLSAILADKTNRQVSLTLSVSVKTIEFHRANIMKKMQAKSFLELIKYAYRLKLLV